MGSQVMDYLPLSYDQKSMFAVMVCSLIMRTIDLLMRLICTGYEAFLYEHCYCYATKLSLIATSLFIGPIQIV